MDNSSKPCGKAICGSLVLLAIGILIGVLVTKYVWPGSSTARARNASSTGESAALPAPASVTASASSQIQAWNPLGQMRQMQAEIDQVFQRSFDDLRLNPKLQVFQEEPGYSLSMDVRDLKDRYQVRAFLPDTKTSDVQVHLDGNQLKVDVTNKTTEKEMVKNNETTVSEWGHYEEVVQLNGVLKDDQMKVQRKEHELLITVPKARPS
jgi:HSP20 family molecular chaperone IbpA